MPKRKFDTSTVIPALAAAGLLSAGVATAAGVMKYNTVKRRNQQLQQQHRQLQEQLQREQHQLQARQSDISSLEEAYQRAQTGLRAYTTNIQQTVEPLGELLRGYLQQLQLETTNTFPGVANHGLRLLSPDLQTAYTQAKCALSGHYTPSTAEELVQQLAEVRDALHRLTQFKRTPQRRQLVEQHRQRFKQWKTVTKARRRLRAQAAQAEAHGLGAPADDIHRHIAATDSQLQTASTERLQ